MPRKPRLNLVGLPQRVIQGGNNREPCFYAGQNSRRYLETLKEIADEYGCRIHSYVGDSKLRPYIDYAHD